MQCKVHKLEEGTNNTCLVQNAFKQYKKLQKTKKDRPQVNWNEKTYINLFVYSTAVGYMYLLLPRLFSLFLSFPLLLSPSLSFSLLSSPFLSFPQAMVGATISSDLTASSSSFSFSSPFSFGRLLLLAFPHDTYRTVERSEYSSAMASAISSAVRKRL